MVLGRGCDATVVEAEHWGAHFETGNATWRRDGFQLVSDIHKLPSPVIQTFKVSALSCYRTVYSID